METVKTEPGLEIECKTEDEQLPEEILKAPSKKIANQLRKKMGFPYESRKGVIMPAKIPKPVDCAKCKFQCNTKVTEQRRNDLCRQFYSLDFNGQRDFLLPLVQECDPQFQAGRNPRRLSSRWYFFYQGDELQRVCKSFFLSTLCISYGIVDNALNGRNKQGIFVGKDGRGKQLEIRKACFAKLKKLEQNKKALEDAQELKPIIEGNGEIKEISAAPRSIDCLNCRFRCIHKIPEEKRIQLCEEFNKLDFKGQKDFICSMVTSTEPKQRRGSDIRPPRALSCSYYFENNDSKHRVCKLFFIRTLCITPTCVEYALTGTKKRPGRDQRALETDGTEELYDGESSGIMYKQYVEKCKAAGLNVASEKVFRQCFKDKGDKFEDFTSSQESCIPNLSIVKYESEIDDTNNEYMQKDYEVVGEGMDIVSGPDTYTIYNVVNRTYDTLE